MASVVFNGDYVKTLKDKIKLKDGAYIISASGIPSEAAPEGSIALSDNGKHYRMVNSGWVATVEFDKDSYFQHDLDSFGSITNWTTIGDTALTTETITPLKGKKSLKYTQTATSAVGDRATLSYFAVPEQAKDNNTHILKFRCRLDSANDGDFVINIIGIAATVRSTVEIVNGKTTVNKIFAYNSADTNLGLQIKVLAANDGASIVIDSIEFSDTPFGSVSLEKRETSSLYNATGFGTTDTKVVAFASGDIDIEKGLYKVTTTTANGTIIEFKSPCDAIILADGASTATSTTTLTLNSSNLTISGGSLPASEIIAHNETDTVNFSESLGASRAFIRGDKVRVQTDGSPLNINTSTWHLSVTATATADYVTVSGDDGGVGQIIMQGAELNTPSGTLYCDGDAVSRTQYAELFNRIGTTYGVGDGSTTFNKPDYRGYFPRGFDDGRGIDTGRVFGSSQDDAIQKHTHWDPSALAGGGGSQAGDINAGGGLTLHHQTYDYGTVGRFDNIETRPKNIAVKFFIRYSSMPNLMALPASADNSYSLRTNDAGAIVSSTSSYILFSRLSTGLYELDYSNVKDGGISTEAVVVVTNEGTGDRTISSGVNGLGIRRFYCTNTAGTYLDMPLSIYIDLQGADRTPAGVWAGEAVKVKHSNAEFDTGEEYIDGRKIYGRTFKVASDITTIGNTVIATLDTGLEPVGFHNYYLTRWMLYALTVSTSVYIWVYYDSATGEVVAQVAGTGYKVGAGTSIPIKYVK